MSMQKSFTAPLRSISDITPEELQAYLSQARRMRSQAFASIIFSIGRFVARPFRRSERRTGAVVHSAR